MRHLSILKLFAVFLWPFISAGKPTVVVSIPPQRAFVEAIAGDEVNTLVLLPPGQSPSNFTITPRRLNELGQAKILFTVGVPMEEALLRRIQSNYPDIHVVDTATGIRKRALEDHHHNLTEAEDGHNHTQDPHIWLSPGLVKIQLRHYLAGLKEILPEKAQTLENNHQTFLQKLEKVDDQLKDNLRNLKGNIVFVYHPAFGYFLERYGLRQETVEIKGKQPSPKQLGFLIKLAQAHKARTIFVQPQFDRHSAKVLAKAIGGKVETMDPLAENYLDNLLHMGETIADSYH